MKFFLILLSLAAFSMTTEAYYYYSYVPYYYYTYYPTYTYGYYYYKRDNSGIDEYKTMVSTECMYAENDSTFKCSGPLGELECEADWKMNKSIKLELFAIGKPNDYQNVKAYKLFPRKIDNTAWMNNVVKIDGERFNITLHSGETDDYGIEVKDKKCFKELNELLKDSGRDELIHLADNDKTERVIADFSLMMRVRRSGKGQYQESFSENINKKGDFNSKRKRAFMKRFTL